VLCDPVMVAYDDNLSSDIKFHRSLDLFCIIVASGDVASKVVIEKKTESVMAFYKGSGDFYLGYITLKVCPLLSRHSINIASINVYLTDLSSIPSVSGSVCLSVCPQNVLWQNG